jgi:hypothetical protein
MFRRPKLSRDQMLDSVPHVNPAVRLTELDTGRTRIAYPKAGNRMVRFIRRLFAIPEVAELLLDEIGTKVIRQVNGTRTVHDLIAGVTAEFKLSRKEAEVALLKYLEMLARRNLVGFQVPSGSGRG